MRVDSLDVDPFALAPLAGSADLGLAVNSPERADAPRQFDKTTKRG